MNVQFFNFCCSFIQKHRRLQLKFKKTHFKSRPKNFSYLQSPRTVTEKILIIKAKIACSSNCKCMGCRNLEDSLDKKGTTQVNLNIPVPESPPTMASKLNNSSKGNILQFRPRRHSNNKHAFSFITDDVIEATSQCLLAISDNAEANDQDEELTKRQIIEEFGRCLMEIIDCSMNRTLCNPVS